LSKYDFKFVTKISNCTSLNEFSNWQEIDISSVYCASSRFYANALVQPHLSYCSIVCGNCGKTLSEKLQKLQNRAARILTSSSHDADAGYLLQQLGWKNLTAQRQI